MAEFRSSIRFIERSLFSSLKEDGECCGISFNECHILLEMAGNKGVQMTDLSKTLVMDKSIISRSVEQMVKKKLILRKEDSEDRRKKIIVLTECGDKKAEKINTFMNEKYGTLFNKMTNDEGMRLVESAELLASAFSEWDFSNILKCKGIVDENCC